MARVRYLRDDEILNITKNDLIDKVKDFQRLANNRIRKLKKSLVGQLSPAYQLRDGKEFNFNIDNLNMKDLKKSYLKLEKFLKSKTSTVAGTKKYRIKMQKTLKLKKSNRLFSNEIKTQRQLKNALKREKEFFKLKSAHDDVLQAKKQANISPRVLRMIRILQKQGRTTQEINDIINKYIAELEASIDAKGNITLSDEKFIYYGLDSNNQPIKEESQSQKEKPYIEEMTEDDFNDSSWLFNTGQNWKR